MGISRFNQPVGFQTQNTYVPIPFEEMAQAAIYRQQKSDEVSDKIDTEYDALDQLQAISGSQDEAKLNKIKQSVYDIRDKYIGQDWSEDVIRRQINKDIRVNVDRESAKKYHSSYLAHQAKKKIDAQYTTSGQYNSILDRDPNLKEGGYDTDALGVYDYTTPVWEQYRSTAEGYFDGMVDSILKGDMRGIDEYSILAVAQDSVDDFLYTNAGKQKVQIEKDKLARKGVDIPSNEQIALATLVKSASERLHKLPLNTRGTSGNMFKDLLKATDKWELRTSNTVKLKVARNDMLSTLLKRDKIESLGGTSMSVGPLGAQVGSADGGAAMQLHDYRKQKKLQEAIENGTAVAEVDDDIKKEVDAYNTRLSNTKASLGYSDMEDSEFISLHDDAVNKLNYQSLGMTVLSQKATETNRLLLADNLQQQHAFIIGLGGFLKTGRGKDQKSHNIGDAAKALGINEQEFAEQIANSRSIKFVTEGPESGMFAVQMYSKSGDSHTVLLSGSPELQTSAGIVHALSNNFRNMDQTPFETITRDGVTYYTRVRTELDKNRREFISIIEEAKMQQDETGNKVSPGESDYASAYFTEKSGGALAGQKMTIDNITKYTIDGILNSGVYGFDFSYNPGADSRGTPLSGLAELLELIYPQN